MSSENPRGSDQPRKGMMREAQGAMGEPRVEPGIQGRGPAWVTCCCHKYGPSHDLARDHAEQHDSSESMLPCSADIVFSKLFLNDFMWDHVYLVL